MAPAAPRKKAPCRGGRKQDTKNLLNSKTISEKSGLPVNSATNRDRAELGSIDLLNWRRKGDAVLRTGGYSGKSEIVEHGEEKKTKATERQERN